MKARDRLLRLVGFQPMAHRPTVSGRLWIYSVTAYLMPVIVQVVFPEDPALTDELVWLVTLVPAFLLSLHYGLRGAFAALLMGTALFVVVQTTLMVNYTPDDPRVTVPIFIAYGALAISVGWLSEQLHEHYELELRMKEAQKTDAIGQLAAGIAHDFNNILTSVMANAELVRDSLSASDIEGHAQLDALHAEARRGAAIVGKLLGLSRRGMLALRPLDLVRVVEGLIPRVRSQLPEVDVELVHDEALPLVVADATAVEQIVMNLTSNARDAMPEGGRLRLDVRRGRLDREHRARHGWGDPGEYLCLAISDTGTGMDAATLQRMFEPFFTTKQPGEGTGLGLAMVYGLMKQHRGFVDIHSRPGEGTLVRVYFPVATERGRYPAPRIEGAPRGGTEGILLVEDEEAIRRAAQRLLERLGYTVHAAADGEEAVRIYRANPGAIDLVVTDVVLPKLTGPGIYQTLLEDGARARFLFMSGYPARTVQTGVELDPRLPFLQKPWTSVELAAMVREVLDAP